MACHHPFTSPHPDDLDLLQSNPGACRAVAYDLVLNGYELGSGSLRNHRPDVQAAVLRAMGLSDERIEESFGFLVEALAYGAPPHGGIGLGLDRIVMLLAGEENLREVVLFPMNQRAEDLLMGAPSEATPKQLKELHISLNLPKK